MQRRGTGGRSPLDQFEHERLGAVRIFEPVDRRDMGMVQRREDLGFALEPGESIGVVGDGREQDLDRDLATQLRVARTIDGTHAALADRRQDLEGAEARAGVSVGGNKWR